MSKYICLFFLLSLSVFALETDSEQAIEVEAESVMVDKTKGVSVYLGDVIVTQGTLKLSADKVGVTHGNKKVEKIIAIGNPEKLAHYQQLPEGKTDYVDASAVTITYWVTDNFLQLVGDANLKQGSDNFSGARLDYDIDLDKIVAKGSEEKDQRVRFTLEL